MSTPKLLIDIDNRLDEMIDDRIQDIEDVFWDSIYNPCDGIERACAKDKLLNRLYSLQDEVQLAIQNYQTRKFAISLWMRQRRR